MSLQTNQTQNFHIGTILSITAGSLYSPEHISGVYDILNYMASDDLRTHQLSRVANECKPYLLEQHPQLANWHDLKPEVDKRFAELELKGEDLSELNPNIADLMLYAIQPFIERYGEYLPVRPIHSEDHEIIDPLDEIKRLRPDLADDNIIEINATDIEPPSEYGDINWKVD